VNNRNAMKGDSPPPRDRCEAEGDAAKYRFGNPDRRRSKDRGDRRREQNPIVSAPLRSPLYHAIRK